MSVTEDQIRGKHRQVRSGQVRSQWQRAKEEIVGNYFDVLEENITANNLKTMPHLVFNCDESALDSDNLYQSRVFWNDA